MKKITTCLVVMYGLCFLCGCFQSATTDISGQWQFSLTVMNSTCWGGETDIQTHMFMVDLSHDEESGGVSARFYLNGSFAFELSGSLDEDDDLYLSGTGTIGGSTGTISINGGIYGDTTSGQWGGIVTIDGMTCQIEGNYTGSRQSS
jgi:hypothetical protein